VVIATARAVGTSDSARDRHADGKAIDALIAKAYARIANAYRRLDKHTRAVNALVLSLKERPDAQVCGSVWWV
jgi:hypothetical protein